MVMNCCFKAGLYAQGLLHDLSKYSPEELREGFIYWKGTESPNNPARMETGYSEAWLHHKGRNKHHFEYWIDYKPGSKMIIEGVDMPRKYIAEMVCDRIAASKNYNGAAYTQADPYNYYIRSEKRLWFVSKRTKKHLKFLLKMVRDEGEDRTLKYIRNVYLKKKA